MDFLTPCLFPVMWERDRQCAQRTGSSGNIIMGLRYRQDKVGGIFPCVFLSLLLPNIHCNLAGGLKSGQWQNASLTIPFYPTCAKVKSGQSDGLRAYCNGHCIFAEHNLYRDFYQSLTYGIIYFWLFDHMTNALC